jgi:purine-binding chemotaxis protein CheW
MNQSVSEGQVDGIDWAAVHRSLKSAGEKLAKENALSAKEAKAVLKARARVLAEPAHSDDSEGERIDILEFLLSGETYAIETSFIAETFPLVDFTPLFCTPPFVMGIINVRGRIVSIVDMRKFFDLPVVGLSNLNRVIVVRDGKMEFAVLADSIVGMRSLPRRDLQASLPTLTGIREEFLTGVTADRLALLDMGKILADRRLIVHEEVE